MTSNDHASLYPLHYMLNALPVNALSITLSAKNFPTVYMEMMMMMISTTFAAKVDNYIHLSSITHANMKFQIALLLLPLLLANYMQVSAISCEQCVAQHYTFTVLWDYDIICIKSVIGLKVRFRLTTPKQCERAKNFLNKRQNSTPITATTTTTTRADSVTTDPFSSAAQQTDFTISSSSSSSTITTTMANSTTAIFTPIPIETTTTTTTTKSAIIPIFRPVRTVTEFAQPWSSHTTTTTTPRPPAIVHTSTTIVPPQTPLQREIITTTTFLLPSSSSSNPTPSYNELSSKAWRSIIRSYTLVDRLEKNYHNLTAPLLKYMRSSPLTIMINNNSSYLE